MDEEMPCSSSAVDGNRRTPVFHSNHPIFHQHSGPSGTPGDNKRKRLEVSSETTIKKRPKRPKKKEKKPTNATTIATKTGKTNPEPKKKVTVHPITHERRPSTKYKVEVFPLTKVGGSISASEIDRALLFCVDVTVTGIWQMGAGVAVETVTAEAAAAAASYLEGKGYKTLPVTRDLVKVLCLRNAKHGLRGDSLHYVSSSSTRVGGDPEEKKVVRHWIDIDPDAIETLKKTSWHLKTASSTIRVVPVTKDDSVSQ